MHPSDRRAGNLNTTAVANNAFIFYALVFTAGALPVSGGTKYPLAKESVLLRSEGAVVNGLGFFNLSPRPGADYLWRGNSQG